MSGKITVSAPGKVILHGEHAVVHFKKAIAVSVGLYTTVEVQPLNSDRVTFQFPAIALDVSLSFDHIRELQASVGIDYRYSRLDAHKKIPLEPASVAVIQDFVKTMNLIPPSSEAAGAQAKAAEAFLGLYLAIFEEPTALLFNCQTELPVGAGLGSSASFAASLVGGMLQISGKISEDFSLGDLEKINRWAFFSEKFVHGSPSGIDNHVTTYGGAVVFQRGEGGKEETTENIICPEIRALLVNTKVARSTSAIIQKTNQLRQENLEKWQKIMDDIGTLVEQAVEGFRKNSVQAELIQKNHELLQQLGVSHPALDKIIDLAQLFGYSGKLTGAGGGGCAFIYIPDSTSQKSEESLNSLKNSLTEAGFLFWDTKLGSRGVRSL
ncbi:unnamed protein product [Allacma fusca]|uniref:Mevalonate kinase n=1 Tax=Allacma fusca TaxID=39272 RepID=A0A8J2JZW5_9HEXA|nr:unnamed protein product [Allacma fusca]